MKKADKSGAAYALIIGDQEMKTGNAILRNMLTKEQSEIVLANVVAEMAKILAPLS
jgi:histidyl-tRNA synthetase